MALFLCCVLRIPDSYHAKTLKKHTPWYVLLYIFPTRSSFKLHNYLPPKWLLQRPQNGVITTPMSSMALRAIIDKRTRSFLCETLLEKSKKKRVWNDFSHKSPLGIRNYCTHWVAVSNVIIGEFPSVYINWVQVEWTILNETNQQLKAEFL